MNGVAQTVEPQALPASNNALTVALVGNPNTGKTSLFNALTGLRQRVGNYHGVTVEKKVGVWRRPESNPIQLVDLPGTYSLSAASLDERVVVDALSGRFADSPSPDAVVVVVDAGNLQRGLFLASQIADLGIPMVIALNLFDVAERKGMMINCKLLEQRLGVAVIPTVATRRSGLDELARAIDDAVAHRKSMVRVTWPEAVVGPIDQLREALVSERGETLNDAELQRLLFDGGSAIRRRLKTPAAESAQIIQSARKTLQANGFNPDAAESILRYRSIHPHLEDIIERQMSGLIHSKSESIDRILLHRMWGLVVFIGMMYVVFQSVYSWAGPVMDAIEAVKLWVQGLVSPLMESTPMLQSLVVDGMIEGVGAFLVFLPQILILFLFIALLEESGYMARAAFLMDKLFHWCGLNGKSFVPLLSSYACAVPGVLATRTIADPKARLITILIAPLMSCSARLPVYILMIGAFVEPRYGASVAGLVLFLMHFVGAAIAAPIAWLLNVTLSKAPAGAAHPFMMELPPYRPPRFRSIFWRMYESGKEFVVRAGTVIFAMTLIIWSLLYFPRPAAVEEQVRESHAALNAAQQAEQADSLDNRIAAAYIEQSYMGRAGKFMQPIFAPAGYDWKITVGVLASFPAREIIISTLGVIYSLGADVDEEAPALRDRLARATWESGPKAGQPIFTLPLVFSIMVFFALCMQCGATVAVVAKELNWKWAAGSFFGLTLLAWVCAVIVFQVGSALS